ncbi:MAG: beta-lactamase family protein [Clostridia bacterium]|nr:beta-lactamase family protein [Clostridia bacterium]
MQYLENCVKKLIEDKTVENIIVRVGRKDDVIFEIKNSAQSRVLTDQTLFDMASVTKIVVTTSLALIAIDKGMLSPSDFVGKFFSVPEDKKNLTVRHLLTHTMGIGHKSLLGSNGVYDDIQEYILDIPSDIPIGTNVRYSCPGFILLGRILETIFQKRLDAAFYAYVAMPLGMNSSVFLPERAKDIVNANLYEDEKGIVNDYNCRYLGGVCGNAGLFSNLADMTMYAKLLLAYGAPLFSKHTFELATQNQTESMDEARGLGYLYVDDRYLQTGGLFPTGSIGHCGHTGQSVFVDPKSGLYVIILSDATASTVKKHGKEKYCDVIQMRHDIHAAIRADLN